MSDEEFDHRRRRKKGQKKERVPMDELIRRKREAENIKVEIDSNNSPKPQTPKNAPREDSERSRRNDGGARTDDTLPDLPPESRLRMSETPPPLPMKMKENRPNNRNSVQYGKSNTDAIKLNNEQRRKSYYEPTRARADIPEQNYGQRRKSYAVPKRNYSPRMKDNGQQIVMDDQRSVLSEQRSVESETGDNPLTEFENDWQEDKTLSESNEYMLQNEIGCDVTFLVGPNEEVVAAHSYVVISRSFKFYKLLSQQSNLLSKVVVILDVNPEPFRNLLRYLYTDEIHLTIPEAIALLPTADKYGGRHIKQKCFRFLLSEMSSDNVCSILELAHEFNEQTVYDKCLNFILVNAVDTLSANGFKNLCRECVEKVVDSNDLNADELSVFNGLVSWANAECSRRKLQTNDKHRRDVLGHLLYCVRYCTMGVHEFTHKLSQNEILSAEEKISLYQYFHGKLQNLPSYLQKSSRRKRTVRPDVINQGYEKSYQGSGRSKYDRPTNNHYRIQSNGSISEDQFRVLRFRGTNGTWMNKGTDAITFRCSESIVLLGIQIYGPPKGTEYYEVSLRICHDKEVIRAEDVAITTEEGIEFYDVMLRDPILAPTMESFTIQTTIKGAPSIRGVDGVKSINIEGVEFEFIASCTSLNGTDDTTGQIPTLLFKKPVKI